MLAYTPVNAQDENLTPKFKEIFKQKKTRLKYMYEFIAQTILRKLVNKQFKEESKKGLGNIYDDKNDNYLADNTYLESLSNIPQFILDSPELVRVLKAQEFILKSYSESMKRLNSSDHITSLELDYFKRNYEGVISHMEEDLEELELIIIENSMKLGNDERYERLKLLLERVEHKKAFVFGLNRNVGVTVSHKDRKHKETNSIKILNKEDL